MIVIIQISAIFLRRSANEVVYHRSGIVSTITTIYKSLDINLNYISNKNRFLCSTSIVINDPDSFSAIRRIIGKLKGEKKERESLIWVETSSMETLYHIDGVHTSQAITGRSFDHVLVGYSLAGVLAR